MKHLLATAVILPSLLSALSLNDAVVKTIEENPQIYIKKNILKSEKELLQSAYSGYLPSVDLAYSVGPEMTQTIANQRDKVYHTIQDASATVTENIFAGFDTVNDVKRQKSLILSADKNLQDKANTLALEVVGAYLDIIRKKKLQDIAQENVAVHKKYLDQIKEKLDSGIGRASDYKQTLSRYENARSSYIAAQQNYKNSLFTFQRLLKADITADDVEIPTLGALPSEDLDELVKMAFENNPTIHVSQADIAAAKAIYEKSKATYYPKADLQARAYWNEDLNGIRTTPANPYDTEDGYNVLLKLSYNIFNGLSDKAVVESNKYRMLEKVSTLEDSKRYVEAYTKIAWQTYVSTKDQIVYVQRNIDASKQTVADYQEEHDLGRRSIIDLLNIELEYNAARNRMVTTQYNHYLAYYQLLSYTGKLLEEMGVDIKQ
jgi:adhesin transport system outer membrane protein